MLVVVGIGNTNIVLGFLDSDAIAGAYRVTTKVNHTPDEYGLFLTGLLRISGLQPSGVDDVIICSMVPKAMHSLHLFIVRLLDTDPVVMGPGIRTDMSVRINDPKSLGMGILADCAGAYYEYDGPVLMVDFGTATTFTCVDDKSVVDSGVIITGIRAGAAALWGDTTQLPEVEITRPGMTLGTNAETCMQADLYYTFLGGVEYTIRRLRRELGGEDFKIITTGDLGRVLENDTELIDAYDPDLILKGMAHIYSRNVK